MKIKFMREAIRLSVERMRRGQGGPFGAIIVRGDQIVGRGSNQVTSANDPTAHAEVVAIRDACRRLKTFRLDDCELYTSCEPCSMCLAPGRRLRQASASQGRPALHHSANGQALLRHHRSRQRHGCDSD
jgi:hypothetical protein